MKNFLIPFLVALIPCAMVVGPVPYTPALYYCLLAILTAMAILNPARINGMAICFLIACALSIVVGDPPSFFKPWLRLGLFALLLFGIFPIVSNRKIDRYRKILLKYVIGICSFVGVTGVFCFLAGINYMTIARGAERSIDTVGWFGGLAPHSMMLGPCGAIGTVTFAWLAIRSKKSKLMSALLWGCSFLCFCSTMLSASRSASLGAIVGFAVLFFVKFRGSITKFILVGTLLVTLIVAAFPMYERFAAPVLTKQENNELSGGTFASRQDRWDNRISEFESSPVFGVGFASLGEEADKEFNIATGGVEPGSSWLAILSMTGLIGIITFLGMFVPTVYGLYKTAVRSPSGSYTVLLIALISIFAVTMCAEGYILAGGSFFCFVFWLLFGVCYSTNQHNSTHSI